MQPLLTALSISGVPLVASSDIASRKACCAYVSGIGASGAASAPPCPWRAGSSAPATGLTLRAMRKRRNPCPRSCSSDTRPHPPLCLPLFPRLLPSILPETNWPFPRLIRRRREYPRDGALANRQNRRMVRTYCGKDFRAGTPQILSNVNKDHGNGRSSMTEGGGESQWRVLAVPCAWATRSWRPN